MNIPEVSLFPIGGANEAFAQYFIGQSYLNMLSTEQINIVMTCVRKAVRESRKTRMMIDRKSVV